MARRSAGKPTWAAIEHLEQDNARLENECAALHDAVQFLNREVERLELEISCLGASRDHWKAEAMKRQAPYYAELYPASDTIKIVDPARTATPLGEILLGHIKKSGLA